MNYKAMPGSILIRTIEKEAVSKSNSGLLIIEKTDKGTTELAEIISVGDERDDLKAGMQILFPTSTGLKIDKNIYYLKYEDICAIIL